MVPRNLKRLTASLFVAGSISTVGFLAPAVAVNGGASGTNSASTIHGSVPTNPPGDKVPGSEGNANSKTGGIPPGQLTNTHSQGLCSNALHSPNGQGRSDRGNPAHACTPSTPTGPSSSSASGSTSATGASTSVLGEQISRSLPAPAVAGVATTKAVLPFTG